MKNGLERGIELETLRHLKCAAQSLQAAANVLSHLPGQEHRELAEEVLYEARQLWVIRQDLLAGGWVSPENRA